MTKKQLPERDTTRDEQQLIAKMITALDDAWWGSAGDSSRFSHLDDLQHRIHDYLMGEMRATYETKE